MIDIDVFKNDLKKRMENSFEVLKKEFSGLRTGRAHPSLLENIKVDSYGSMVPINQCGNISAPEARLLIVSVWDKNLVKSVEKAIVESNLGLNPMSEGNIIRVNIPELTEERRKDIIKVAKQYSEKSRVSVRNIRRDAITEIKKSKLPEDVEYRVNDEIQKITDDYVKNIDESLVKKEQELIQL